MKGHTLVIPRREVDYIFDLTDEELAEMTVFAKRVAAAIKKAFPCIKVGMAVLGLEVPHAHIHLVPMNSEKDMNFANPKLKLDESEFQLIAERIRKEFVLIQTNSSPYLICTSFTYFLSSEDESPFLQMNSTLSFSATM